MYLNLIPVFQMVSGRWMLIDWLPQDAVPVAHPKDVIRFPQWQEFERNLLVA